MGRQTRFQSGQAPRFAKGSLLPRSRIILAHPRPVRLAPVGFQRSEMIRSSIRRTATRNPVLDAERHPFPERLPKRRRIAQPPAVVSASALTATLLSVSPAKYSDRCVIYLVSLSGPRTGCSRNHREAPAHHQNSSFNPYCMMRGFTLIALIFPKVLGLETLLAGFAKFG